MSDDPIVVRKSMWREGLDSFQRYWRSWFNSAAIFFFIILAMQAGFIALIGPLQDQMEALKGKKDPHAAQDFLMAHWMPFSVYFLTLVTVLYVQHYVFYTFFLQRELPGQIAKASVGGFFYFIWKLIQVMVLLFLIGIVVGVAVAGVTIVSKMINLPGAGLLDAVVFAAAIVVFAFFATRWTLVMPLAAGGVKASIKTSWVITKGNIWRLIGNSLMIALVFMGVALAVAIILIAAGIAVHMSGALDNNAPQTKMVMAFLNVVFSAFWQVVMYGVISAYVAAVCRILYEEKQQADPSFVLESSA